MNIYKYIYNGFGKLWKIIAGDMVKVCSFHIPYYLILRSFSNLKEQAVGYLYISSMAHDVTLHIICF